MTGQLTTTNRATLMRRSVRTPSTSSGMMMPRAMIQGEIPALGWGQSNDNNNNNNNNSGNSCIRNTTVCHGKIYFVVKFYCRKL